uniref:Translation initiation factor IF-2, chloroplastic n=1 Tax=Rhodomonas salina TaxID=3034 RepID=IF2C_RHOSW|nr:translation initiation factor 2 [Rhodomonas salina]A6MVX8.1 RecName: Full=Translation initiation factor IF-2, chloroplastic [Rhodomonas salina]ABO70809.1 translation initiation factor 2 [Rhodomonas salina]
MNNNIAISKENTIKLSFPLVFDTKTTNTSTKEYVETIKEDEKVDLFDPTIDTKLFVKPDRKTKKNDKSDQRDSDIDIIKTKLKSKKKEKSKFRKDEDYDSLKREDNQSPQGAMSSLPFARPEVPAKKMVSNTNTLNKKNVVKSSTKKSKKQTSAKNRELEQNLLVKPENVVIAGPLSVQELAVLLTVSETEIIRSLFLKGIGVTINQILDVSTAKTVGEDLGINIDHVKDSDEESKKLQIHEIDNESLEKRPPVIAIMGHVDHGKTTLLDKIRKTQIAQKEAGGITQKIGAYEVEIDYKDQTKKLTFLDTPGHEAFSGMRSRGVQVTDIAILVVAADDGVKPQTVEAIKYIQAANVPIIVAINKIDKENADIENIKQQLTQYNLIPENWGGDTLMVPISAMKGTNMENLLEMIILVSEIEDLKANTKVKAQGTVLEAHLDRTKGAVATLLVQNGTLRIGDILTAGTSMAKIRGMINSLGEKIEECLPSSPVLIWGLSKLPASGEHFEIFDDEKQAKIAVQKAQEANKENQTIANTISENYTLSNSNTKGVINLIIKTDIQGSAEAIIGSINKIPQDKVQVRVLYASAGEITETDIDFADTSGAIVLAFNTSLATGASKAARHLNVKVKEYDVIYDLLDYIELTIEEITGPEYDKKSLGKAIVQGVFPLAKSFVAGLRVTEGKITKNAHIEVIRQDLVVFDGSITSLKKVKEDIGEAIEDSECGLFVEEFDTWQENDIVQAFELIPKKRKEK